MKLPYSKFEVFMFGVLVGAIVLAAVWFAVEMPPGPRR